MEAIITQQQQLDELIVKTRGPQYGDHIAWGDGQFDGFVIGVPTFLTDDGRNTERRAWTLGKVAGVEVQAWFPVRQLEQTGPSTWRHIGPNGART